MSLSLETITTSQARSLGAARDGADHVVGFKARVSSTGMRMASSTRRT